MSKQHELTDDDPAPGAIDDGWTVEPAVAASRFPVIARIGVATAAAVLMMIVAVFVVPMVAPASLTVGVAERLLGGFIGADVQIGGDHQLVLLPAIRIDAENLIIRANETQRAGLEIDKVELELSSFGAISGSVDIRKLALINPIASYVGTQPSTSMETPDTTWGWWRNLSVSSLVIEGGALRMADVDGRERDVVTDLNVATNETDSDLVGAEVSLTGDMNVMGQRFELQVSTSDPSLLVAGNRWPFALQFQSASVRGTYDGSLAMRERLRGEGVLTVAGDNLQSALDWMQSVEAPSNGGPFTLRAELRNTDFRFSMPRFNAAIGGSVYEGTFDSRSDAPASEKIRGRVSTTSLNVNHAIVGFVSSLAKMLPTSEISMSWPEGNWRGQPLGRGNLVMSRASRESGVTIQIEKAEAFGGILRGAIKVNQSEGADAIDVKIRLVGAAVPSVLGFGTEVVVPPITGAASISASLFSVGRNATELVQALVGTADVVVVDGGLDMPELVEELDPAGDTRTILFDTLNGRFVIGQGIAKSEDLIMQGDGVSLVASGMVDLLSGRVDLEVGRLENAEEGRSMARYKLSGQTHNLRVDALN